MPYAPATDQDIQQMLDTIGVPSIKQLFNDAGLKNTDDIKLDIPLGVSEAELIQKAHNFADNTLDLSRTKSFLGCGSYDHFVPAVVRAITSRSEYATAYTPYQPELSQGTLQTIFEFQSSIAALTGLPVANASLYDGATAVAEAAYLAEQTTRRSEIIVLDTVAPHIRTLLNTYAKTYDMPVHTIAHDPQTGVVSASKIRDILSDKTACVIVQSPNAFGLIEDAPQICADADAAGAIAVVSADPISLGILEAPGNYGAGVVVGDGHPLGLSASMGGPTFGFMSVKEKLVRRMPGRIVGETVDLEGTRGYVLTLQTREQHIRREKATSNICTNQALCALAGLVQLSWLGPEGIKNLAAIQFDRGEKLVQTLSEVKGVTVVHDTDAPRFREVLIELSVDAKLVVEHTLKEKNILAGWPAKQGWNNLSDGALLVAATELRSDTDIEDLSIAIEHAVADIDRRRA